MPRFILALAWLLAPSAAVAGSIDAERVQLIPATSQQILDAVRSSGAKVAVVNVWATWCLPCREELPHLLRLRRAYHDRGLVLLLVSGDFAGDAASAREFLAQQGVDFPTYLKVQPDQEFIDAFDRQWSGALPATFLYDGRGERRRSILSPVRYESLEREVASLLADRGAEARFP
jgi:thiol-disulfide isomerase/thioredoxin